MKIAINARMLKPVPDDGISRFTFEVVKRITVNNPSHKFVLIFDKEYDNRLLFSPNTEGIVLKPASVIMVFLARMSSPGSTSENRL
jgi:hypothetical protein